MGIAATYKLPATPKKQEITASKQCLILLCKGVWKSPVESASFSYHVSQHGQDPYSSPKFNSAATSFLGFGGNYSASNKSQYIGLEKSIFETRKPKYSPHLSVAPGKSLAVIVAQGWLASARIPEVGTWKKVIRFDFETNQKGNQKVGDYSDLEPNKLQQKSQQRWDET
ncbi:hypothetical protein RJT34_13278 [Clitoria ternatea]|uniref:Uncharacterized protein n=1 Tax=Clitoria ternatea TaxID=43366 RepID=A0AAN9PK25_CLITE